MLKRLLLLFSAGLAWHGPAGAADLDALERSGTLRLLAVPSEQEKHFLSMHSATRPGFDREVLEGFAKARRLDMVIVPVEGWDALVPALLKGRGDVIGGGFTATDARRAQIEFTDEIFPTRTVVVTRKPSPPVTSLEQLRQAKLGTIRGSSMAEDVLNAGVPPGRLDLGIPSGGLSEALKSGRVNTAAWALEGALLLREADPQLELGLFLGKRASLAYGVRKEDARLREALNGHIRMLRQTGTWNRLVVKYFGDSALELLKRARE